MNRFTKILVPVDFSPQSDEAVRYAVDLAKCYEASITLLHVYEPIAYPLPEGYLPLTPEQFATLYAQLESRLSEMKEKVLAAGASRVETQNVQGSASSEIADFANAGKFDLIVMGTHGRRGVSRAFMGSVAEMVLRRATCPVLAVKQAEAQA